MNSDQRIFSYVPLVIFIFGIVLSIEGCSTQKKDLTEQLTGSWLRSDGNYTIDISEAEPDGRLVAMYFNPNPIHVGRSGWRIKEGVLQVYIELSDENYPGSIYQLIYHEDTDELSGTYYQAVTKQTYQVYFKRKN